MSITYPGSSNAATSGTVVGSISQFNPAANGTTDDSAVFTTAAATYDEVWLAPNKSYFIGTNLTLACALRFVSGASLIIGTGVTLILTGVVEAPLIQIFTIQGTGKVTFGVSPNQKECYPEWWGAVGDNVHDDTVAIQAAITAFSDGGLGLSVTPPYANPAGGTVVLGAKSYKTTATLVIAATNVNIRGCGVRESCINLASATLDILQLTGTAANNAGCIAYVKLNEFAVVRSVSFTNPACAGIRYTFSMLTVTSRVDSFNSAACFDLTNIFGQSYMDRCVASWGGGANPIPTYGFSFANSLQSSHIYQCQVNGCTNGYNLNNVTDLFMELCETASCTQGYHITGSGGNIQISHPICDSGTNGMYFQNFTGDRPVIVTGGYLYNIVTGIPIENSTNIIIQGMELNSGSIGATPYPCVWLFGANCYNNIISHTNCRQTSGASAAIRLDGAGVHNNIIEGNNIHCTSAISATGIGAISATRNVINNNMVQGFFTTGISLDASSNNNSVVGNVVDPTNVTTPITNLGTGNLLSNVTT